MSQNEKPKNKNTTKLVNKLVEEDIDDNDNIKVVKNIDINESKVEKINSPKKKKVLGRVLKDELYKKEQMEILEKFNKIIKFDGKSTMFYIEDINENDRKIIDDMASDIRKFYKASVWRCANNENSEKVWILLLKNVYKNTGYKVNQYFEQKVEKGVALKKTRVIIEKINE